MGRSEHRGATHGMLDSAKRPDPPPPGDQKATEPWAMPGLPPQGHLDLSPIPAPLSPARPQRPELAKTTPISR